MDPIGSSLEAPRGYELGFEPDGLKIQEISCYMVKYRQANYDLALKYAKMFFEIESVEENEDYFVFYGDAGTLTANKEATWISFEANPVSHHGEFPLDGDQAAIRAAEEFITGKMLVLFYEEVKVHFDQTNYRVTFINRISELKNYAFYTEATLDQFGRVMKLEYCNMLFDRIGRCQVKPMGQAFRELPALGDDEAVLLSSCQLVYIYDDSIVQPAYYFTGYASGDRSFECFVKAAIF
jgi:hypothetical protein